jgi:hypothetical protein
MYVLLQVCPPDASGGEDDRCCCLDVIAVDASEAELERYLASYEYSFRAACGDFDAWDSDLAKDWGSGPPPAPGANERCARRVGGRRCEGTYGITMSARDWKRCSSCSGLGFRGDRRCNLCWGTGWAYVGEKNYR